LPYSVNQTVHSILLLIERHDFISCRTQDLIADIDI
jgi:hypothetical protein